MTDLAAPFLTFVGLISSCFGLSALLIWAVKHLWLACIEASNEISIARDDAKVKRTLEKVGQ